MKVAISTDGEFVSAHFGRCPKYTILDIENNKVVSREIIENPGHHPGFLPQFLKEKGVNCVIAGGMGQRAKELFNEAQIDTILGVEGKIQYVIDNILKGTLKGKESLCKPESGKGYGVNKSVCDHK